MQNCAVIGAVNTMAQPLNRVNKALELLLVR